MSIRAKIITYIILSILSIIMLLPLGWMIDSSFKGMDEIFHYPPTIVPAKPILSNYTDLFKQFPFGRNLFNSAYIAITYTLLAIFFCSLGGFSFAKYEFPGKEILFSILLGSMLIPFEVTMVPLYVMFRRIGWIDSHLGLVIPGVANAFGIFFMRQYAATIPNDLLDSARIDGCSEFRIFLQIIIPIIRPAMASLGIIFFMSSWNNFLWPLIVLKSPQMLTAPVALRSLQGALFTPYNLIMAGSVLTTLPLLVIFLILQRQFISGIVSGALKM